jgi:hypothetical protein
MEDPETELVGSYVLGLNSLGVAYKFVVLTEGGEQKDRSFTPKIATLKLKTEYIDVVPVTPLSKSEAMKLCDRFIGQDKDIWEKIKDLDSVFNKYDLILDKIGKMISTDADDNELDGVKEGIDYIAGIVRIFGSTVITETIYTDIKARKAAMEYIAESKKLMEEKASDKKNGISGSTNTNPETEPATAPAKPKTAKK